MLLRVGRQNFFILFFSWRRRFSFFYKDQHLDLENRYQAFPLQFFFCKFSLFSSFLLISWNSIRFRSLTKLRISVFNFGKCIFSIDCAYAKYYEGTKFPCECDTVCLYRIYAAFTIKKKKIHFFDFVFTSFFFLWKLNRII